MELRHQHLHLRHIARLLAAPFSTVARALNRLGLGRSRNLEPKPPVQRYEWEHPGDLIHIDVKKLARFRKVGHRITGNRQRGRSAGVGYDRVHVAIDDATRLAYVEVLADEQQAKAIGFLSRAVVWFNGKGVECRQVMSDNGPAYLSRSFVQACKALGVKQIRMVEACLQLGTPAPCPTQHEPLKGLRPQHPHQLVSQLPLYGRACGMMPAGMRP